MATLEELVVSLTAETKGLRTELQKATTATQNATSKIDDAVEEMSTGSQGNITAFQNAMSTMAGFIGGQIVIGAFNKAKDAALGLFKSLVADGVAAAQIQEDAINSLNAALARTGRFSDDTSKSLQSFASELQSVSRFGDEALLQNMALIQSLGDLDEQGLKRATQSAANLSAALGIDLKAAATLVGKAAAGEVSSFSRYGVVIEAGATKAKTFENALTALEQKFGGAAQADVQTYSGRVQQLQNTWGDFTEEIGFTITQNQVLLEVMGELNKIMNESISGVNENRNALQELVGEGIQMTINAIGIALVSIDQMIRALEFMAGVVNTLLLPLNLLIAAFKSLTDGINAGRDHMKKSLEIISDQFNSFSAENKTAITPVIERMADLSVATERGMANIKAGVESTVKPMNQMKDTVVELTEAEQKRQEQLNSFVQTLLQNASDQNSIYATELENLGIHLEERLITEEEYWDARLELLEQKMAAESQILEDARAKDEITEEEYQKSKTQLQKQQNNEARKLDAERIKDQEKRDQLTLQAMQQLQGGLLMFTQSGNKQIAGATRALATFNATVMAYQAIQNALANVPYPANIAAAAGIGAQAFANIARINGVGLNKGGTVPGTGPNTDSVPAMLTPGEEVVNRDTANMLRDFLQGQSDGGSVRIELSMREEMIEMIEARIIERQRVGVSLVQTRLA